MKEELYDKLSDSLKDALSKETKESWEEFLSEEPVSEDLEEAANEYCNTPAINNPPFAPTEFIKEAFKAGAQWQKQQTVEKAVEWLNSKQRGFILTEKDIEDFKKYMEK